MSFLGRNEFENSKLNNYLYNYAIFYRSLKTSWYKMPQGYYKKIFHMIFDNYIITYQIDEFEVYIV